MELMSSETATMERMGFDEERSMLETWTSSLADSFPKFELRSDAVSDTHRDAGERRSLRIPTAEILTVGRILWASPWSCIGLFLGILGLLGGAKVQRSGRILEFWGGYFIPAFLRWFPLAVGSAAAPFGHVVLGRSDRHVEACRPHQMIHVQQYERWGLLFVPTYLICTLVLWCRGKRPYYDNPFERQAYDATRW